MCWPDKSFKSLNHEEISLWIMLWPVSFRVIYYCDYYYFFIISNLYDVTFLSNGLYVLFIYSYVYLCMLYSLIMEEHLKYRVMLLMLKISVALLFWILTASLVWHLWYMATQIYFLFKLCFPLFFLVGLNFICCTCVLFYCNFLVYFPYWSSLVHIS